MSGPWKQLCHSLRIQQSRTQGRRGFHEKLFNNKVRHGLRINELRLTLCLLMIGTISFLVENRSCAKGAEIWTPGMYKQDQQMGQSVELEITS